MTMRIVEVVMSIPGLVIALAASAALGPNLTNLVLVLGSLAVPYYVRVFRSEAMAIRERGYVRAARASGANSSHLLWRHVLPNLAPTIATFASMALAGALVTASALSFIGLGAQPPQPEWGALIYEGRNNILYEWWCSVLPGVLVSVAALGFILVGDGLRDFFDPQGGAA
jgi:peptide/nickel transport system permease protein